MDGFIFINYARAVADQLEEECRVSRVFSSSEPAPIQPNDRRAAACRCSVKQFFFAAFNSLAPSGSPAHNSVPGRTISTFL